MLGHVKQTPIFDENGKISSIENTLKNTEQDKLFEGADVIFVVAMPDALISMNYSKAIRDGDINLKDPLNTTKLLHSAYSKEKIKSLGISPHLFKVVEKVGSSANKPYNVSGKNIIHF
jgi:hypothetical protein